MAIGTKPETKIGRMKALLARNPKLNSQQLSTLLGCDTPYVRAMAKRLGVTLEQSPMGPKK